MHHYKRLESQGIWKSFLNLLTTDLKNYGRGVDKVGQKARRLKTFDELCRYGVELKMQKKKRQTSDFIDNVVEVP